MAEWEKPSAASSYYWLTAFANGDPTFGRLDHAHKRRHLDLDMETQLIDAHNFDEFRKHENLIIPSEDEASKETQLINGDEVHSGSSSGKDGEVDSALSPLSMPFSQKQSQWISEFTRRDRSIEGIAGRAPHMHFPFKERYLGETQMLSVKDRYLGETQMLSVKDRYLGETQMLSVKDRYVGETQMLSVKDRYLGETQMMPVKPVKDRCVGGTQLLSVKDMYLGENQMLSMKDRYFGESQILSDGDIAALYEPAKDQRKFAEGRPGGATRPDLRNRDSDVPHYLRDFDPSSLRAVGSRQKVSAQTEDRGWKSAVRNIVDSDTSTQDEEENHPKSVFSTGLSYPPEAPLSQNVNPGLSSRVTRSFFQQDLNKSPEPEYMVDDWVEESKADLGIGKIDKGGSNLGLLNDVQPVELAGPSQLGPMGMGRSEVLNGKTIKAAPSTARTAGPSQLVPMGMRSSEVLNGRTMKTALSTARTAGSIRSTSLRASALQASTCSSSGRYKLSASQGSRSDEIHKVENNGNSEVSKDAPQKVREPSTMSRLPAEIGHSATSLSSMVSFSNKDSNPPRINKDPALKIVDCSDAHVRALPKVGWFLQGQPSSALRLKDSEPAKKASSVNKHVLEDENERDRGKKISEDKHAEAQKQHSPQIVDVGRKNEAEPVTPRRNRSSPREKSLERRNSFGSGLFSSGNDMSYLNSQSPGEESQAGALNMVDKLVWLNNNISLPQELKLEEDKARPRGPSNAKSVLQSRVQVAEAKVGMDDAFGVFDWVDSQTDDGDPFFDGTARATGSRGAAKTLFHVGQSKQSGIGSKKGEVGDTSGSQSRKAEKLNEKAESTKQPPNTDKHKGSVTKTLSAATETIREHQGGRPVNGPMAMDIRQEHVWVGPALGYFTELHQDKAGNGTNRRAGLSDKTLSRFGPMDFNATADKARLISTFQMPCQQNEQIVAEQAPVQRSQHEATVEQGKEATNVSRDSPKVPDVQKEPIDRTFDKEVGEAESNHRISAQSSSNLGPRTLDDAQAIAMSEARVGNVQSALQETAAPDKTEEGGLILDTGDGMKKQASIKNQGSIKSQARSRENHLAKGNRVVQPSENGFESLPQRLDKGGCSPPLQQDANIELSPIVGPVQVYLSVNQSPCKGKPSDNAADPPDMHQASGQQQQSCEGDVGKRVPFDRVANNRGSTESTLDGTKLHSGVSGHLEESSLASIGIPTANKSECRDSVIVLEMQNANTGPVSDPVIEQTLTLQKNNSTSVNGGEPAKDEEPVKNDEEPVKKDEVPVKRDEVPVNKDEVPTERDEASVKQVEVPVKKDEVPVKQDEEEKDEAPAKDEVTVKDEELMKDKVSMKDEVSTKDRVQIKENGIECAASTSETASLKDNIEDKGKPKIGDGQEPQIEGMPNVSKKGKITTRRGRSQTRYNVKLVENSDPLSANSSISHEKSLTEHYVTPPESASNSSVSHEKGRGRRVTWAGPLEQVRRQSTGVRSSRCSRQQIESRREDVDSSTDSSGEEEGGEDLKETLKTENGSRKRNVEALGMGAGYNDLDKIKRRFNMSDAAVARLLGTDEEEEEDPGLINDGPAVKVRSLNHIQPEADTIGDEVTAPNFRKVSKGLRSVRSRSEEGVRRAWSFSAVEQGRLISEEVVSTYEQHVAGNVNGRVPGDGHPSDNELITGRRRMRSIADVSFSNLLKSTPGRPPTARGFHRRRGRHVVISPPETATDLSDDDDDLPPSVPPSVSPLGGQFRGKGGPRSIRKRKELDPDLLLSTSEVSTSPNSSKEASPTSFKKRRRTGTISVLLSHGLKEDIIKHQKRIVAKLGGRVAHSASECSHFVADKFVRTGNMLEAMASGKPVVNIEWLETCSKANRFVDEEDFILQDEKKEDEMGFSMMSTITGARQRPLLQGIRVYITPGTSPGPDSLARIVESAGGEIVDEYFGPAAGEQESNYCIVISSEDEFEDCIPLLEQGAKVFTPELILSGVTSYHLDFSNDQLFKNFILRRRRGSSSRRTT